MKTRLHNLFILINVGLFSLASQSFVSADPMKNRCPKSNPYPFRNKTSCCSVPVDFQWNKSGYCYGRSYRCNFTGGCENYHPQCNSIESLRGIDFPLNEYNVMYRPVLIPTTDFSHKFVLKEVSIDGILKPHCLWKNDVETWILGSCNNIENNDGDYFLDIDSECPNSDDGYWKDVKSTKTIPGRLINPNLKRRVAFGRIRAKSASFAGIFATGNERRKRVRKCLEWKKLPYKNQFKCSRFDPPRKNVKESE